MVVCYDCYPLLQSLSHVIFPPDNAPLVMAKYMDDNIPKDALIETWEPEMGFLTDHNYHYPPQILLDTAVGFKWRGGPAPSENMILLRNLNLSMC